MELMRTNVRGRYKEQCLAPGPYDGSGEPSALEKGVNAIPD